MKYLMLYETVCLMYKSVIRPILFKAIDDPSKTWDDLLMKIADAAFHYPTE